ncbi:hypothetical protein ACHAQJ_008505 [Trichoderma viride]
MQQRFRRNRSMNSIKRFASEGHSDLSQMHVEYQRWTTKEKAYIRSLAEKNLSVEAQFQYLQQKFPKRRNKRPFELMRNSLLGIASDKHPKAYSQEELEFIWDGVTKDLEPVKIFNKYLKKFGARRSRASVTTKVIHMRKVKEKGKKPTMSSINPWPRNHDQFLKDLQNLPRADVIAAFHAQFPNSRSDSVVKVRWDILRSKTRQKEGDKTSQ